MHLVLIRKASLLLVTSGHQHPQGESLMHFTHSNGLLLQTMPILFVWISLTSKFIRRILDVSSSSQMTVELNGEEIKNVRPMEM